MTSNQVFTLMALWLVLGSYPSLAENHQHDTHHEEVTATQQAHVHGIAQLFLVLENDQLSIELHSPAMNMLGFEHKANNPEQKAIEQKTLKVLTAADSLFQFEPDQCQISKVRVDIDGLDTPSHQHAENKALEHESHKEHHADHHESLGHRDIEAHYQYHCKQAKGLHSVTTNISSSFPGIQSLQVQWIANGRQGAITLDNSDHHILFR